MISHRLTNHPLYNVWKNMKKRCYNKTNKNYKDYGGRGISICKEWKNDFKVFYDWAISHGWKYGLEIDRIDNSDNQQYSPTNCRFVTKSINSNNKRNNRLITYLDKTQTLTQWATELPIKLKTLHSRFKRGWTIEKALTTISKKE